MRLQIAGTLYWGEFEFELIDPHPMIEKEHWMNDTDEKFKVIMFGKIFDIIVSRPFLISRLNMGSWREVRIEHLEKVADIIEE